MIKVNKKNKAKNKAFEFLTIFSMVFGVVVGGGIYLKNSGENGVLAQAGNNPYLALAVWVFIGVLCSLMMLTFIEAASSKTKSGHSTAQSWANTFVNRKTASLFSIMYICMYLPILTSIGALFVVKTFFEGIEVFTNTSFVSTMGREGFMALKIFLSTVILVGFSLMNIYTQKPSKLIQSVLTFVKFIPLLCVVIGGFAIFIKDPSGENSFNQWHNGQHDNVNGFNLFFATAVPILFAFDGFIYAATLQKDCEHKEVVAPAMLSAIIAVTIFYVLITVGIFFGAKDGDIFKFFDTLFKENPWVSLLFKVIITCTLFTVVNGYTTLIPKTVQSAVEEGFIFSKSEKKDISIQKAGYIGMAITLSVYTLFLIISIAIGYANGDKDKEINYFLVADLASSSTVIFAFIAYLIIMIGVLHNRRTNKVEVRKVKGGFVIGIITTILVTIMVGYICYVYLIDRLLPDSKGSIIDPILLIVFSIIIFISWVINECLFSKQDIDNNDFILRINPKNWFKYNKELEIEKFKSKSNVK
ncbi:APC family permease [Spiroplasma sp. BIUS-1]|uniref:APC family permease n=1 Tax=Spiroplasma sp. BIUS-1 TaxID=216964 RepID=UPI001398C919|nr:APC family permease [Spiroplasma sp. BIUS-1]QHX37066.1 basic amino acid/polyamine antiporter, APA family [Spiroplasma sp. BIUS-1]